MTTQVCAEGTNMFVILCTSEPCVGGELPGPWVSEHTSAHAALKAAKTHRREDQAEIMRSAGCCPTCRRTLS